MKVVIAGAFAALLLLTAGFAAAQPSPEEQADVQRLVQLRDSLRPVHGMVKLPGAKAVLNLGDGYYFLPADDARRVLVEGWKNTPQFADGVIGMIFPAGKTFLDDTWGAVVRYENTFYVSDEDAKTADYDGLLSDMHKSVDEENIERKKEGFESLSLIGWAQAPTYEPKFHDLIWAREIQFGDEADHTLNYDVRHLGRNGVLNLSMISSMSSLADVRQAAVQLVRTAEFEPGSRYADYKKGDKTAGYGLAGLVAAGVGLVVAKQAGLLAGALLFLKKGALLVVAAAAGVAGWFRTRFGKAGKPDKTESDEDDGPGGSVT